MCEEIEKERMGILTTYWAIAKPHVPRLCICLEIDTLAFKDAFAQLRVDLPLAVGFAAAHVTTPLPIVPVRLLLLPLLRLRP